MKGKLPIVLQRNAFFHWKPRKLLLSAVKRPTKVPRPRILTVIMVHRAKTINKNTNVCRHPPLSAFLLLLCCVQIQIDFYGNAVTITFHIRTPYPQALPYSPSLAAFTTYHDVIFCLVMSLLFLFTHLVSFIFWNFPVSSIGAYTS